MSQPQSGKTERFRTAVHDLLIPLRQRKGLSTDAVASVVAMLEVYAFEWQGSDLVPKREMSILVDLYPAMISCAGLYEKDVAAQIELAGDQIADLIRKCVQVDWDI